MKLKTFTRKGVNQPIDSCSSNYKHYERIQWGLLYDTYLHTSRDSLKPKINTAYFIFSFFVTEFVMLLKSQQKMVPK